MEEIEQIAAGAGHEYPDGSESHGSQASCVERQLYRLEANENREGGQYRPENGRDEGQPRVCHPLSDSAPNAGFGEIIGSSHVRGQTRDPLKLPR